LPVADTAIVAVVPDVIVWLCGCEEIVSELGVDGDFDPHADAAARATASAAATHPRRTRMVAGIRRWPINSHAMVRAAARGEKRC
jgi:hypothetical protein